MSIILRAECIVFDFQQDKSPIHSSNVRIKYIITHNFLTLLAQIPNSRPDLIEIIWNLQILGIEISMRSISKM